MFYSFRAVSVRALILVMFVAPGARADEASFGIDDAVASALDASPLVQAVEATLSVREAEAFDARTLPNPGLDIDLGVPIASEGERGKNEFELALTQPFRLSHGALRNRLAALSAAVGRGERETELLGLVSRVRLAFARSWVLSERANALQEILPLARSLNKFVQTGLEEGAYGQGEGAIFRSETAKTEAALKGIAAESIASLAELNRLTARVFHGKNLLSPRLPSAPSIEMLKSRLDSGATKVQKRGRLLLDLAKAEAAVARRDAYPEFRPRLFYSRTNEAVDILGVGVSFDLPFYSQNTGERLRTDAGVRASQAQLNFNQSDAFKSSVVDAVRAYALRSEELLLYEKRVLPALREALTAFEQQVRKGEGSIFQLWQTLREYIDTNEAYLELWTRVFSEGAELSILLGEEIEQ